MFFSIEADQISGAHDGMNDLLDKGVARRVSIHYEFLAHSRVHDYGHGASDRPKVEIDYGRALGGKRKVFSPSLYDMNLCVMWLRITRIQGIYSTQCS